MQSGASERLLLQDFRACLQQVRKGVLVQPSVANTFQWQVTMMPNNGIYKDQILTYLIIFDNFPASVPKIVFQPGIVHPLIYPQTRVFDTSEMFKEWNVSVRVYTLINYIYDSFIEILIPGNREVPNPEAASKMRRGGDAYAKKLIEQLPPPPSPTELSELNVPKNWNKQKERIAHILSSSHK
ncbi:Ubiquitin-conjugating enzyme family protein [Trichomonas vaginalis G3]|uniref:Ubiquitin-conjugating enzyme family protein n=1 Tax=Trichomonas vaginalis (strain ATCC PRA-98 / G3) TaxID=412133 RepID=A2DA24_TRIV3|nr:sperm individualization protein family [Trichomonas vaginalis G3]EAY22672.1 Ubiquitin-conjugating enzyme family protein [Trichomonas vaginalis G3]KAI5525486.1 sperm individualization protein family [Trichomonas vaginalis G3]|eukprot:XP_001583658.1 Ubiquitin-conjugating enzyme family protein [Trichomonas vaginalis G3]